MPFKSAIFGSHLAGWMILGMSANYLWDLFRAGKGFKDIRPPELFFTLACFAHSVLHHLVILG